MSLDMATKCNLQWKPYRLRLEMASSKYSVSTIGHTTTELTLMKEGKKGRIIVKRTPVWIIEDEMEELLIGEDLLKVLGINIGEEIDKRMGNIYDFEFGKEALQYPKYGGEDPVDIERILLEKVKEAKENGLPESEEGKWLQLLMENTDQFRQTLAFDPQAKLPEMKVNFVKEKAEKVRPVRIPYTLEQEQFMDYYAEKLIRHGYCYENPEARYVSESLVIPKVQNPTNLEEDYRLVVNLKRANMACEPHYWPLPTFEDIQKHFEGAKYFITLDLKNGYWQIGLHRDSQELFSFCTHRQVLTPYRIPQGSTDAVMFFTYLMMKAFEEKIYKGIVPWLDDLLLYCDTIEGLFQLLKWVLKRAEELGLKFSPKKLVLFAKEIKWCGKIITSDGVKVDPKRIEALTLMPIPTTADQLMTFVNASNWIRTSVIDYAAVFEPLYARLKDVLGNGKKTKRRAARLQMDLKDDEIFKGEFEKAKAALIGAVCLCHPKKDGVFCLTTDASDRGWGAVLFQVETLETDKAIGEQNLEPLSMISGNFKGAQLNWSVPEKEAYAIVEATDRLRQLLIRPQGFVIFTDHKNLIFTYDPMSVKKLNVRARIDRWVLKMRGYRYTVRHIAGIENLWSDLLSRWGAPKQEDVRETHRLCRVTRKRNIRRHIAQPVVKPIAEMKFPTKRELQVLQEKEEVPDYCNKNSEGLWVNKFGRIWIPKSHRISMMTISHYGIAGHKSVHDTLVGLEEYLFWENMDKDVDEFVLDCILCRCAKMVLPTRIHLGIQQRPTKPNKSVHFDYFYVGDSDIDLTYLLVIRDGFSRFVMIFPVEHADALTAVRCLLEWIGLFGIPERFFSDNGPHFRNTTMRELIKRLHLVHDFSTVYCAWANGFIERILRVIKALLLIMVHELAVDRSQWHQLRTNLLMALNHRPSASLAGLSPIEVHTGLPATNTLEFYIDDRERFKDVPWTPNMLDHLADLSNVLDYAHEEVYKATEKITQSSRKEVDELPEFEIGDYVLHCFVDRPQQKNAKLYFKWVGPFQIVDTKSKYVYHIKDLVQQRIFEAHVDRLSFYSTKQLHLSGELLDLISREGLEYDIQEILDVIWDEDKAIYVVKTLWSGFNENEATYEPFDSLLKQVPLFLLKSLNGIYLRGDEEKIRDLYEKEKEKILACIRRHKYKMKSFDFIE